MEQITGQPAPAGLPFLGIAFGCFLSLLFFVDQNVTSLLTQAPEHRLKKGNAYHWNFLILGVFNIVMPLFGCPFITGSLPHSPQFVQALAVRGPAHESSSSGGSGNAPSEGGAKGTPSPATRIVSVHENRLSPLLVNVLVLMALFLKSVLTNIPFSVLSGLFLYMGTGGLLGNPIFLRLKAGVRRRCCLRRAQVGVGGGGGGGGGDAGGREAVAHWKADMYTAIQIGVLATLFALRFTPIGLVFPLVVILSIPLRLQLPRITGGRLDEASLRILDGAAAKADAATAPLALHDTAAVAAPLPPLSPVGGQFLADVNSFSHSSPPLSPVSPVNSFSHSSPTSGVVTSGGVTPLFAPPLRMEPISEANEAVDVSPLTDRA